MTLTESVNAAGAVAGRVNPDWVEWLMGWPVGWTSLEPLPRERVEEWLEKMRAGTWWDVDPADAGEMPRTARGIPDQTQRLRAIGNGQFPLAAAAAWRLLSKAA